MGYAAVVSDEDCVFNHCRQIGQRQMFRESDPRILPDRFELPDLIFVRFTGNDQERAGEIPKEMICELNPILQRPVFLMASASGMKCNQRRFQSGDKLPGTMSIFG